MDTYLSVRLPNIWSPIIPPREKSTDSDYNAGVNTEKWVPYEFKWIENIGAKMISQISITCGNYTLQEYSGDYLLSMVQRDFSQSKKDLFDKMTGNVPELNDPANSGARVNSYPNAYYTPNPAGCNPSIGEQILYIPLNSWFNLKSQMAFPLIALQYNELHINITLRPISQLYQIRDVLDAYNNYPYVAPNFNIFYQQFYRFLQPPPDITLGIDSYSDMRTTWNADINLNCTYCFLSNEESRIFAANEQKYLFKQIHEYNYYNVTGPNKVKLDSTLGLVSNYMFYFQRSDVNLRNEWSNYTNWPYNYLPYDIYAAPTDGSFAIVRGQQESGFQETMIGPGVNPDGNLTGLMISDIYNSQNIKEILQTFGILLDGNYRENPQPAGVFNYIEKYTRTTGNAPDGLYCYNFCLNTNSMELQPSGAINMSRFNQIEFEFTTIYPPADPLAQVLPICDPVTGQIVGVNKPTWRIYMYNFDLTVFEERINMIEFIGGNAGLVYAT
jgi:hypothetical protein